MKHEDLLPEAVAALPDIFVLGVSVFDPVWSERTHSDTAAELLCVVRGGMTLEMSERRFRLRAGDIAVIPPNNPHRDIFSLRDEPEIFLARFKWRGAKHFFAAITNEQLSLLSGHDRGEALALLHLLQSHAKGESPLDQAIVRPLLHALLLKLWHGVRRVNGTGEEDKMRVGRRHELMMRAKALLDQEFATALSLEVLSRRLNVSPYYLSRVFSQEAGFSLISYLTEVRMKKARELLARRAGNVSQVAYAVGYENPHYFSRVFKSFFGYAPSFSPGQIAPER